jgi:hypothetical protein
MSHKNQYFFDMDFLSVSRLTQYAPWRMHEMTICQRLCKQKIASGSLTLA